jgi:hypothetical protein
VPRICYILLWLIYSISCLSYSAVRARVSKQVTNGSKTAVIDVIGFLCVPLGSSTVQLHDSLGRRRVCACSEADFSSQNGDSAWGVSYRREAFSCAFLWVKGLNAKDIHKEMFPVYGGKCLSRKAVHNWVDKFSQRRLKVADEARPCAKVAETVEDMSRNTCFPSSIITCFAFYIHLWHIYRLSFVYTWT